MIRALFVTFLVALGVVLFTNRSENVVGADASGYASLARMLDQGQTIIPTRASCPSCETHWFVPIGFVPAPRAFSMASMYPVGLPLHLALAARIGGWDEGLFVVSPIAALLLVVCTFWVALRLHSELAALVAAMIMGLCAVLVMQALQPMSDVLAAMWSVAAVAAAAEGRTRPWCFALAGFCFGMAVLVRPTSLLLVIPLAIAFGGLKLKPVLGFVAGGIPAAVVFGWYNVTTFGQITASGYAVAGAAREFALAYFPARAAHYGRWTFEQFGPLVIVAAVVGLVLLRRRERWMLVSWMAAFYVCYSFYYSYDAWWYTRFLLPAYPAIAVAAGVAFAQLMRSRRVAAVALIVVALAWEARQLVRFRILYTDEDQYQVRLAPEWLARALPPRSLVFSMELSGALTYYTDHRPLRWDLAPPERALALARAEKGPVYALLMEHEEKPFRTRYGAAFRRVRTLSGGSLFAMRR